MKIRQRMLAGSASVLALVACGILTRDVQSQPPPEPVAPVTPPADQTYVGGGCSSCHFKEYMTWKKTKHSTDAFIKLPAKYHADPKCLICHSTGFGTATGFKDETHSLALAGTTCEACHGPGSKHVETAKPFAYKNTLTADEAATVRGTIYKVLPQNVCIRCHVTKRIRSIPSTTNK